MHVLEFKNGHFPSSFAVTAAEMEEERRLLYVASSRAMEDLIYYKAVFSDSGSMQEDSPFLEVIAPWLEVEKATRPAEEATFVPFEVHRPIDMRARLLGG